MSSPPPAESCPLCRETGGLLLFDDGRCRIVQVDSAEGLAVPGFCRVIWQAHVREMSDLSAADRAHLLALLLACEQAVRKVAAPDKINLAAFGNWVPHLHWHVIPRWQDDSHFPEAIWAPPRRPPPQRPPITAESLRSALLDLINLG